jgi:uncharacterized membrane protein
MMNPLVSLPITALLIYRSLTHNSLTIPGILFATLTALIHASHPSPLPFTLLVVFFLLGTSTTKVKRGVKQGITLSATGWSGREGRGGNAAVRSGSAGSSGEIAAEPRTHIQVLVNSGMATLLVLLQLFLTKYINTTTTDKIATATATATTTATTTESMQSWSNNNDSVCVPANTGSMSGLLLLGIVANYAAVTADTMSSELGILASTPPRLVTRPWVVVARGTNGGVTPAGLVAGAAGAGVIGLVSAVLMPFCSQTQNPDSQTTSTSTSISMTTTLAIWITAVTACGTLGSLLDSLLGAVLQASVVDRRTGKIVEGAGGERVLVDDHLHHQIKPHHDDNDNDDADDKGRLGSKSTRDNAGPSRTIAYGADYLDNNQINLLMATCMTVAAIATAAVWWGMISFSSTTTTNTVSTS